MKVTYRKLSANIEGDGCCHWNGHKCSTLLGQQVSQDTDQDSSKEKPYAHLYAVLRQG